MSRNMRAGVALSPGITFHTRRRRLMKLNILAIALAATAFGSLAASAQSTTIIEERRSPSVVIEQDRPASTTTQTKERSGLLGTESKTTTTTETSGAGLSPDCKTKTVERDGVLGS